MHAPSLIRHSSVYPEFPFRFFCLAASLGENINGVSPFLHCSASGARGSFPTQVRIFSRGWKVNRGSQGRAE